MCFYLQLFRFIKNFYTIPDVFPLGFWSRSIAIRYASYHFQNRSVPTPLRYENHAEKNLFQNGNRRSIRYENWNGAIAIRYDGNIVLNISGIFWACYTKNNYPLIFPKYKKPYFLTSVEILNFTFQINLIWNAKFFNEMKENPLKLRNYFVFKSKHTQMDKCANSYLNNFMLHVEILLK